ncbi:membrane protein implicated in regulation of membrane protease activity [Natronobacillus azotifigens]|uniref:Uncharacterized protein n=1 Tax=Natronobacillus azotifigens TaxID=472978 RepID=A0A9J6RGP0_9BACI|nr:hypothetical protein [Natronobacillus azotifigens]MCZ0704614.1 hypothetical protein [Natronobacillus azotifigens]
MKCSLFRFIDVFEAFAIYLICFASNLTFIYVQTLNLEGSFILTSFLKGITDYQVIINVFLTFIIIVFHYQFLNRRKTEISCRILVGDTMVNIVIRYILNSLAIMVCSFLLSLSLNLYLEVDITSNLYLVLIFIVYILISAGQVKKE